MKQPDSELLVQVLQNISVPTLVLDRDHTVTIWNSALETLTGVPAAAMVGTKNH